MLFNSPAFLLYFLPCALCGFYLLLASGKGALALRWLVLCSLFFYGQWEIWHLPLLVASAVVNLLVGQAIGQGRRLALPAGIAFDLLLLAGFKYLAFFLGILGIASPQSQTPVLPLGISFFTFQQIAYLVDVRRGLIQPARLWQYLAFVSFFPQLIAGPIVQFRDMMPQFKRLHLIRANWQMLALGTAFFSIGLFKKVVLADHFATISDPVFADATHSRSLTSIDAWLGMLAYSFQIYFDFSGYADMAIGLGLLFGIRLPINFDSPYKARNIIDFWRRWHLTLSRFLRDYVYIPLGGNHAGRWRRGGNLLATMLLGGLWHGASWNFILWGGMHGLLLAVNHLLRQAGEWRRFRACSISLTFFIVTLSWIPFRAQTLEATRYFYAALWKGPEMSRLIDGQHLGVAAWLLLGGVIIWGLPNTQQWFNYQHASPPTEIRLHAGHGFITGLLFLVALKTMASGPSQSFIYFVF